MPVVLMVGIRTGWFTPTEGRLALIVMCAVIGGFLFREIRPENLFQFDSCGVALPDTCADAGRYVKALDKLNDPHIAACVDVGHAILIRALGHDRLKIFGLFTNVQAL